MDCLQTDASAGGWTQPTVKHNWMGKEKNELEAFSVVPIVSPLWDIASNMCQELLSCRYTPYHTVQYWSSFHLRVVGKLEGNGPTDERAAIIVVSEANFDLKFEISNLNYPGLSVHIAIIVASEAMATSKWLWRSHLTSDWNSVT